MRAPRRQLCSYTPEGIYGRPYDAAHQQRQHRDHRQRRNAQEQKKVMDRITVSGAFAHADPTPFIAHQAEIAGAVTPFIFEYGADHPAVYGLALLPVYGAIARVKVHGHWQSDVIVGAAVGAGWGWYASQRDKPLVLSFLPGGLMVGFKKDFWLLPIRLSRTLTLPNRSPAASKSQCVLVHLKNCIMLEFWREPHHSKPLINITSGLNSNAPISAAAPIFLGKPVSRWS